jgi:2-phospho-L-lactate/phosphoenolpyruvate guanylyltransferase
MDAGVLPVKSPRRAKSRLDGPLGSAGRIAVAEALYEDALALVAGCDFLTWWVVSDDDDILRRGAERGLETVHDAGEGLNRAVADAVAAAARAGALSVMVVAADLPLARPQDLRDVLDTGATSDVVLVPSDAGGTNVLYLSPPDVLDPQFGVHSLGAHMGAADALELRATILSLPALTLDIDTADDLDEFLSRAEDAGPHTAAAARRARRQDG